MLNKKGITITTTIVLISILICIIGFFIFYKTNFTDKIVCNEGQCFIDDSLKFGPIQNIERDNNMKYVLGAEYGWELLVKSNKTVDRKDALFSNKTYNVVDVKEVLIFPNREFLKNYDFDNYRTWMISGDEDNLLINKNYLVEKRDWYIVSTYKNFIYEKGMDGIGTISHSYKIAAGDLPGNYTIIIFINKIKAGEKTLLIE